MTDYAYDTSRRPDPDDPVVIDSASGTWFPGIPSPTLMAVGRGHAWTAEGEGYWRLVEPDEHPTDATFRAVVVARGRYVCRGEGCVRVAVSMDPGDVYVCPEHQDPPARSLCFVCMTLDGTVRDRDHDGQHGASSGVDMSTGMSEGGSIRDGTPPDLPTTRGDDPRRKEPDMARAKTPTASERMALRTLGTAAIEAPEKATRKRTRKTDAPMTNAPTAAAARKAQREAAKAATVADPARKCIGAPKFGIAPHEAPTSAFGKHSASPDGLSRMCRAHWPVYTKALAAAKAGNAPAPVAVEGETVLVTEAAVDAPALTRPEAAEYAKGIKAARRRAERAASPDTAAKRGKVAKAAATLAAIESLPGPDYVVAMATDEVQDALEVVGSAREVVADAE